VESLQKKQWWTYLEGDLQELLNTAILLVNNVEGWEVKLHDYSFVVFPAAKAYEGFLKKLFLDRGFISEDDYYGKRFRIGKALNPSLDRRYRKNEGVYDKIVEFCGGKELADNLWDTWKTCRNLLFHWFPNEKGAISFKEARQRVGRVVETMDAAYGQCKISEDEKHK